MNEKLKVKLKCQQKLVEKYKKKYYRNKLRHKTSTGKHVAEDSKPKSYQFYKAMIMNIRKWYKRSNSRLEKRMISIIIVGKRVLKKYGLGSYARSVLGISQRYMYDRRIRPAGIKSQMKIKVKTFLERDDNSRITSDKQSTITRHGLKMQKRLLNGDLKTLHKKYESENNKMSYSMFCKLRPFWIVKATEKDRDTCLCKMHENIQYKINTSYRENMIHSKDINVLMNGIVCNQDNKKCMYRECDQCCGKELMCHAIDGKQVVWKMWKNKRIHKESNGKPKVVNKTVKDIIQGTKETLAEELNTELTRICRHIFNIRHQYTTLKLLHEQISNEEIVIHIDFSENYNAKYASEIQSMHFGASKQQISLHTGVAYIGESKLSFCTVSDCLKHGPAAIWAHLDPVIKYLKENHSFTAIHFISDGPTTQYRNKDNFYLWCNKVFEYGCTSSTWNFLEAAHGKGAADGVGAAVKRAADKQVNTYQKDITCGKDLIRLVEEQSSVKMFYVEEQSILNIEANIPTSLQPVKNTMKLHQLNTRKRGEISCRVLSCYCTHPSVCRCFQPIDVQLPVAMTPGISDGNTQGPTEPPLVNGDTTYVVNEHQAPAVSSSQEIVTTQLKKVTFIDESLIGNYVVVTYDELPYPGVIVGVDEDDLEIKVMHRIGRNRYFWPLIDDQCWYTVDKIVTLLDNHPEHVTSRHCQIPPKLWELIEEKLNL